MVSLLYLMGLRTLYGETEGVLRGRSDVFRRVAEAWTLDVLLFTLVLGTPSPPKEPG